MRHRQADSRDGKQPKKVRLYFELQSSGTPDCDPVSGPVGNPDGFNHGPAAPPSKPSGEWWPLSSSTITEWPQLVPSDCAEQVWRIVAAGEFQYGHRTVLVSTQTPPLFSLSLQASLCVCIQFVNCIFHFDSSPFWLVQEFGS